MTGHNQQFKCSRQSSSAARLRAVMMFVLAGVVAMAGHTTLPSPAAGQSTASQGDELSIEQARLADRFTRLEVVLARLAELSADTDPQRARLLRETIAKSRGQNLNERFETIVTLLEDQRLSSASRRQTELQKELDALLTLLLKADRGRELESQHRRVKRYLQEVGRLIRLQKGIKARTEGGDDADRLVKDQQQVADQTGELGKDISETERASDSSPGDPSGDPQGDGTPQSEADQTPKEDSPNGNKSSEQPPSSGSPNGSQSPPSDSDPSGSGQSPPPSGNSGGGQSSGQQQQPTDRAAERLKSAQQRMQQAQEQLDKAEREGAAEQQREAIQELELAKAELERILRQLREEEIERTLTQLAARFRKMLDAQLEIYDGTVRLDRVPVAERDHNDEIEAARLSREESLITREADRAHLLLREEGSSVAFPETVSLMRDDMQQVTRRLADIKTGQITQALEEDIIESLEEMIAALDKAIEDLEKKRTPPGQSPPPGEPADPALVDKLAELKMIRSLQMRINRRTERYGKMIEGEQADAPELLEVLTKLAERQERVYQATYDLSRGRND